MAEMPPKALNVPIPLPKPTRAENNALEDALLEELESPKPSRTPRKAKRTILDPTYDLKARAAKVAREARARHTVTLRIHPKIFQALVELAEDYRRPVSNIAVECLVAGVSKYRDFNSPHNPSPFSPSTPFRMYPEFKGEPSVYAGENSSVAKARANREQQAADLTAGFDALANEAAGRGFDLTGMLPNGGLQIPQQLEEPDEQ